MALTNTYLITTKNLDAFFNAIIAAKAPERFTQKFLQQLEFTSSNDRFFISLLKTLGFIDEAGVPTQRYYDFLDQTQSGMVLAEGIKEAYEDLFAINKKAHQMTIDEVKNKLRTLTQGQKTDNVINLMANTFKSLCEYAEWGKQRKPSEDIESFTEKIEMENQNKSILEVPVNNSVKKVPINPQLHYNIQIHLPETRDAAVYDAIFRSLKEHLM